MKILQASFFWKNDKPQGLGFSFGLPSFSPDDLHAMFFGPIAKEYLRNSDNALGSQVVDTYLGQLADLGYVKAKGTPVTMDQAILASLNIMWLVERGFIPNDEFNGVQYITQPDL